jgi:acyl dehydratase
LALSIDEAVAEGAKYLGTAGPIGTLVVEESAIRRFAAAIGDSNPLYSDPEFARTTRWGGIIAPPTFLCLLMPPLPIPAIDYGTSRLNGGTEFHSVVPVRPGDVITGQCRLGNVRSTEGRGTPMLIQEREYTYVNQTGAVVCRGRAIGIQR